MRPAANPVTVTEEFPALIVTVVEPAGIAATETIVEYPMTRTKRPVSLAAGAADEIIPAGNPRTSTWVEPVNAAFTFR